MLKVVLEEDGTQIDDDVLLDLDKNTLLVIIEKNNDYEKDATAKKNNQQMDTSNIIEGKIFYNYT